MAADGSQTTMGSGLDDGNLVNSTARYGNYTNVDGSPSGARVVSYYTERIRDQTSKTIDQIEIEVATDIAASLSALCETELRIPRVRGQQDRALHARCGGTTNRKRGIRHGPLPTGWRPT